MQYPIQVDAIYLQSIQTMHPDLMTVVKFAYKATVNEDETVEISEVNEVDGNVSFELRIKLHGEHDSAMERFLANIREHARAVAYQQIKAANKQ